MSADQPLAREGLGIYAAAADLPPPPIGLNPVVPWAVQAAFAEGQPLASGWKPPAELMHLHVPVIVSSLWRRLLEAVREPVHQSVRDDGRWLQVSGWVRLLVAEDGTFKAQVWRQGNDGLTWVAVPDSEVVLAEIPAGWTWLGLLRDAAMVELSAYLRRMDVAATDAELQSYGRSLFDHFRRLLGRYADLRVMRRRVAETLGLDQDLLRISRRLMNTLPGDAKVRLSDYNLVRRRAAEFRLLERELPQAISIYAAMCGDKDFPVVEQPAQALREHLQNLGHGNATWRRIVHASPRLFLPLRDFYAGRGREAMLDYLNILGRLQISGEPPRWLVWEVFTLFANPGMRFQEHIGQVRGVAGRWAHALRIQAKLESPQSHAHELGRVLEWARSERPRLDKLQRRSGWPWLLRASEQWEERRRRKAMADVSRWESPFAEQVRGAYLLRPIASPLELWEEGHAMRHCANVYEERCASGQTVMVSVRRALQPDRRVATALLVLEGSRWRVEQVRGPANRNPEPGVEQALSGLVAELDPPLPDRPAPDPDVTVGKPPAGAAPAHMPPNARLIAECSWYWSPYNSRRVRYQICSNRQRTLWVLWERPFDTNWDVWLGASIAAYMPRRAGDNERLIACRLLKGLWVAEIESEDLDQFSECRTGELLLGDEVDLLADMLWSKTGFDS